MSDEEDQGEYSLMCDLMTVRWTSTIMYALYEPGVYL